MYNKKRILFIIWSLSYGGGAEKILANIVNNFDYEKYDIEILEYLHADKMEEIHPEVKIHSPIIDMTQKNPFLKLWYICIDRLLIKIFPGMVRKLYLNKSYDVEISFN